MIKIGIGLISMLALMLAGCSTMPSRTEMDYGNSLRMAKAAQIVNPEAGKNLEPVMGFDGRAGWHAIDKYQEDFKKPAPKESAFTLAPVSMGTGK